jgi:carbon-monoxide dehydrogenase large subunit
MDKTVPATPVRRQFDERPHHQLPEVRPRMIGRRVPRVEDPGLVTGSSRFLADLRWPGEQHLALLRSPIGHARIRTLDVHAASKMPGVRLVWTGADTHALCDGLRSPIRMGVVGSVPTIMPLLAQDVVRYAGEPVVAVVANSRAAAEDACERVLIDYDPLPIVLDARSAFDGGPVANDSLPSNVALDGTGTHGDVEGAFAAASHRVSATYRTGRLSPSPLETRGCAAEFEWASGTLRLWSTTQVPYILRALVASVLDIPDHRVEVLTANVGGGFGLKAQVMPEEMLVCLLSRALDIPVKWVEDRREHLLAGGHAHAQDVSIEWALDPEGRITAQRMDALCDGGAYHSVPWAMSVESFATTCVTPTGIYDVPAFEYRYRGAATNKCPVTPYRGVGFMVGTLAREALADEAARALELSPFEFRRRSVVTQFPHVGADGMPYSEGSWLESIDELERLVDYPSFLRRQAALREEQRFLGLGICVFAESSAESTALGIGLGYPENHYDTATVRMDPGGTVVATTGLPSQGQGQQTTMAQIIADVLGIDMADVTVRTGQSTATNWSAGTTGSRAAVIGGGALMRGAGVVAERLKAVAAAMLEIDPADLELADGTVRVVGDPANSIPISKVSSVIYNDIEFHPPGLDQSLEVTLSYDPRYPVFSNGAMAFIVEVDIDTGLTQVEHAFAVEDCGRMLNPMIVEGQIRGGMTQGIGAGLLEDLLYDGESGALLADTLSTYLLPTAEVVPRFTMEHIETFSEYTPAGAKGLGEAGLIGAPAAMLNAVNDALSPFRVTVREIPVTPDRILEALETAR